MQTLLLGAKVYTEGHFVLSDILIQDGLVSVFEAGNLTDLYSASKVFDFTDKYIFPGFADVHVHFREPGFLYKEDISSGSMAAAAGGYTHVCAMPNLKPVPDSAENLAAEADAIKEKAVINVFPFGSVTKSEAGAELSDMFELIDCIGFSDDGVGVVDDDIMRQAMLNAKAVNKLISAHCEYKSLIGGKNVHAGKAADALGYEGISSESEWKMIARDLELAEETGCSYHVCHISTKESVDIIRAAKRKGIDVTCETGPHYLLLSEEDIISELNSVNGKHEPVNREEYLEFDRDYTEFRGYGRYKMNPPLRSESDREALVAGILDGTIDMIATDHAPHSDEEKEKGFDGPMGVVGLECAFPVLYTGFVKTGILSLEKLIELMSIAPAKRFGLSTGEAGLENGNFTVFDLKSEFTVTPSEFKSKGRYTPFEGKMVLGKCLMTVCNSQIVYCSPEAEKCVYQVGGSSFDPDIM